MSDTLKPYTMITDFVTGQAIPNVGAEENRQAVERYLVDVKGYSKNDIEADVKLDMTVAGKPYSSQVDLVVTAGAAKKRIMAFKCAAGSLGSREREIVAAARLLDDYQIPLAVVSDGKTAIVLDTISGKKIGEGLDDFIGDGLCTRGFCTKFKGRIAHEISCCEFSTLLRT